MSDDMYPGVGWVDREGTVHHYPRAVPGENSGTLDQHTGGFFPRKKILFSLLALAAVILILTLTACGSSSGVSPACQRAYDHTAQFVRSVQPGPSGPSFGELVTYRGDLSKMISAGCPSTMEVPSLPGS